MELDKTKKYDLSQLNDEQLQAVLDWLKKNDTGWGDVDITRFRRNSGGYNLRYDEDFAWHWIDEMEYDKATNALELFSDDASVYDDMLSLIEKGKQHGLKIVVTFEKL